MATSSNAAVKSEEPQKAPQGHRPIHHTLSLKDETWARVYLNQFPFYKRPYVGPDSTSGMINELLVPGKNTIAVELLKTAKLETRPYYQDAIKYDVYEVLSFEPVAIREIFGMTFPDLFLAGESQFQRYPYYYETTFDPGVPIVEPPWMDAPKTDFGCEGTKELRDAVARLHAAMVAGNADAFLDEIALRLEHTARAFDGDPEWSVGAKAQFFRGEAFSAPLEVRPLDFSELHFRPLHDGRVASVTRYDEHLALHSHRKSDPNCGMSFDLLMTQHDGRWMVFA